MRRTLALTLGFVTLVGLASPAAAAEEEAPSLDSPDARVVAPMACKVMQRERQIGVGCSWREAAPPATAYRLGRLELGGRKVIFRTGDLSKHSFLDLKVRPGLQYAYVLQVLGEGGALVAQSRFQLVLVRPNGDGDGTTTTTEPGSTATNNAARRPIGTPSTTSTSAPGGVANVRPAPPATTGPGQTGQTNPSGQANQANQAAQLARLRAQLEQLQAQLRERQGATRPTTPTTQARRPGAPTTAPSGGTTPTTAAPTTAPPTTNGATRT